MNPNAERQRPQFSFDLDGLSEREQMLFKSLVRMLDHRMQHQWHHEPGAAHIRVTTRQSAVPGGRPELVLGGPRGDLEHWLDMPLRADAVESALNRIGHTVADSLSVMRTLRAPEEGLIRLTRWPGPALLSDKDRLRLATLLTARPISIAELERRVNVSIDTCRDFIAALAHAGMLSFEPSRLDTPVAPRPQVQPGLLTRIRMRLGLGGGVFA